MSYKSQFDAMFEDLFMSGVSTAPVFNRITTSNPNTFLVDTSRYEIIEKPEWKKKMLEQEIETLETKLEHYEGQIEHLLSIETELKNQKKELKKQLKSLDIEAE